jgi:NIPSNAP
MAMELFERSLRHTGFVRLEHLGPMSDLACSVQKPGPKGISHVDSLPSLHIDPNKRAVYEGYVAAEMEPITRSGGNIIGYFLPTDYAGPTKEAHGLIEFPSLASYEQYRHTLAEDASHKKNNAELESSAPSFPSCARLSRVLKGSAGDRLLFVFTSKA